jgi:prepilin-type N-terminal cleavage/methylation domain-containing protein
MALKLSQNRGVTIIEIIVAVGIFALVSSISIVSFANFNRGEAVKSNASALATALRDARSKTLASVGGSQFGVKVDADRFTSFQGSTFSSSTPGNVTFMFNSYVVASVTPLTFVFSKLTGNVNAPGTILLYARSSPGVEKTITVQATGLISVQ